MSTTKTKAAWQSRGDVYSTKHILAVTHVKVMRKHGYGYLEEIVVRRADNVLYIFKEGDIPRLQINDIEDMLLLVINITKPDTTRPDLRKRRTYTPYKDPQGFIYVDDFKRNMLMRSDEQYKFSDGTLTMLLSSLEDITKNIYMEYLPKRRWSTLEKKRAHFMIKDINKPAKERRKRSELWRNLLAVDSTKLTSDCCKEQYDFVILCSYLKDSILLAETLSMRFFLMNLADHRIFKDGGEAKKAQQNQNPEAGQTSMARDGSVFRYTHVSRSTLKRDAMKLWLAAKQEIIDSFGNINACVNLTTDVWSAPHGVPGSYMCVTAHWIEPGTWQMMKRVISFEEFPSPHTGGALFKMLTKVLTNFNLEDKVMSITLDNASNNTSAMDKLKLKYEPPMGGRFYHSRCVAHIINLVVQAGLEVPAIDAIRESFKTMLKDIFKSSARTRQRYVKICKDAEKPCLRPNWDVPTRWNSTYHMFLSGLKQQNTLAYFHDVLANKNRSALNPCFNVSGVDYLIENISRDLEFQDDGFATRTYKKKARNDPTMSSEYEQYLKADFVSHLHPKDFATFDVLGFWKAKENQFPVLSRMAMDILSVQASSVASESAFSTSGRLLTINRTRLTPESLEMCMCLKDHLDAQERKQDTSPLELSLDVEESVFNVEVQQNEATQLTDQEIELDASSDSSSGEPRHDYMMSSEAEDDQTGDGHDGSMSHGYY
ncbi:zinc finger BED domain-containing protein RICESLEEPER 2-like protein [Tanacetum coccineum]